MVPSRGCLHLHCTSTSFAFTKKLHFVLPVNAAIQVVDRREGWKQERQMDYTCSVIRGLQHASLRPAAFDWTASKDNQTGHNNKEIHINSGQAKFWFPTYRISRVHTAPSAKWLRDGLVSRHRVIFCTLQLKRDGTRWRTGGEVKGETGEWCG